jgi:hypothetical protein
VRKVLRSGEAAFVYEREVQPLPKLGGWRDELERLLAANGAKPRRERLTLIRVFEELRGLGYAGGYDAVRRHARRWQRQRDEATVTAYVPLSFAPGEAYQFDWSYEVVVLDGATTVVKVAHFRLCSSRMPFVRAYPRESQEMVFDAHDGAFRFFGGACERGIYDKPGVERPAPVPQGNRVARTRRGREDRGRRGFRRQGAPFQPPFPADVRSLSGRTGGLHARRRLGEGSGREPGGDDPRASVHAAAAV